MKKGLSVLLIAAALFGFYGGATSLNDVLASKDYWEEVGEKSTADMNKLEDGLNQLKDNENAYLDGQKTLVEGEKTLADGEAQYQQGLADYAAAPAKLADGERKLAAGKAELAAGYASYAEGKAKLAAGKAALAEGEKSANEGLAGINTVIGYINQVKTGYADYSTQDDGSRGPSFKVGYQQLADGRKQAVATLSTPENQKLLGMIAEIAGDPTLGKNFDNESSYKDFNDATVKLIKTFNSVNDMLSGKKPEIDSYVGLLSNAKSTLDSVADKPDPYKQAAVDGVNAQLKSKLSGFDPETELALLAKIDEDAYTLLCNGLNALKTGSLDYDTCRAILGQVIDGLSKVSSTLSDYSTKLTGTVSLLQQLVDGYNKLTENQATIHSSLKQIYGGILNNATLKSAFQGNAPALYAYMSAFTSGVVYGNLGAEDLPDFIDDMDVITSTYNPAIIQVLQGVKQSIAKELAAGRAQVAQGEKDLAAGAAELADGERKVAAGEAELAQGYADYAAAPAKLADAEKQLADGRKQLADGKKKLAEYEDGEQQVRDGLATLMATEADPGLESILERRNGDDKFDDANGHLQLDEGLEAVEVGRGYQAESGDLITKEVTNRAVGTAAGLGAAALAVLAAILSFLKKNKGAAVSAVLAAVAGGIGAGVGLSAGEYYSDIAGSTIGNTPFIAAAVIAVVAAVFAIVHFTAKPEAK